MHFYVGTKKRNHCGWRKSMRPMGAFHKTPAVQQRFQDFAFYHLLKTVISLLQWCGKGVRSDLNLTDTIGNFVNFCSISRSTLLHFFAFYYNPICLFSGVEKDIWVCKWSKLALWDVFWKPNAFLMMMMIVV